MNADQARALFLEHCEPGDLSHYGEKAAVAAILAVAEQFERHSDDALLWALTEACPNEVPA